MKRLYRLLLRLYPGTFRRRFGEGLLETWRLRREEARRRRGPAGMAWFHLREAGGIVAGALRERIGDLSGLRPGVPGHRELRHAARRLRRSPGFAAASALTLAMAIGATAAIYSFVKGVVLDPLPYPDSERIVRLDHAAPGIGADRGLHMTRGLFHFYRENARTLEEVAIYRTEDRSLTGDGGAPLSVRTLWASWTLFPVLGVDPALGRGFVEPDGREGAGRVAVLADGFWHRRYGGDPGVLGRSIRLDGEPHEIVGVLPPGRAFPDPDTEVIVARVVAPMSRGLGGWVELGIGRAVPGAGPEEVERELRELVPRIPEAFGGDWARRSVEEARLDPVVTTLKEDVVRDVEATLWILMGTVAFVLLIACSNVANLFLVRAEARRREVAVRRALGGGRAAAAGLYLAEAFLVALVGGVLGTGAAVAGLDAVVALAPPDLPRLHEVEIDGAVLLFAAAVTLGCALLFGVLPALGGGGETVEALKEGGRGSSARTTGTRQALVVAQIALALVLLVGSGLTIRSFRNVRALDPGFRAEGVLTFLVDLSPASYETEGEQASFHAALLDRLEGLPGVERAGAVGCLPLRNCRAGDPLYLEGETYAEDEIPPIVRYTVAAPGYFEAMGVALLEGRTLEARDHEAGTGAVVVSRELARRFFPEGSPLGRRISVGLYHDDGEPIWYTIAGVVEDVPTEGLTDDPWPLVYYPLADRHPDTRPLALYHVVRSSVPPGSLVPAVRRELEELDAGVPLARVAPMEALLDRAWAPARFTMVLLVLAGAVAVALGLVGIYGVVSYVVSLRRPEIGLRIALGAGSGRVRRLVLGQGALLAGVGVVLGLGGALGLSRVLESILFRVGSADVRIYAAACLLVLGVSLAAAWLPARRASRLDPMEVLKAE